MNGWKNKKQNKHLLKIMEPVSEKLNNGQKRKPKNEIKFNITLNEEQKAAKAEILQNTVTLLKGQAGSGKTLLACQIALDMFFNRQIEKIIITRPNVASAEEIGFLPGSMRDKMDPWLAPIYANLYMIYNKQTIEKMVDNQEIEIVPFAFVRGRTFVDACVIVDEAQNVNSNQTEMIVGRLGINSKMIFCGDTSQIDLKNKRESGIDFFKILESRVPGVKVIVLQKNHRHPIVPEILNVYKEYGS
jgi:phosphate starvation-inducible protein PhoH and related proteins